MSEKKNRNRPPATGTCSRTIGGFDLDINILGAKFAFTRRRDPFSVQEEVGLRGTTTSAFGDDPLVGIALDVTLQLIIPVWTSASWARSNWERGLSSRGGKRQPRCRAPRAGG